MVDDFFAYDPLTGIIVWRVKRPHVAIGQEAGHLRKDGYRYVEWTEGGITMKAHAHRVAWRLHYGEWPPDTMQIDHVNCDRLDNSVANLRLATPQQNRMNEQSRTGRPKGIRLFRLGKYAKWQARIKKNGKTKHLGYFDTQEDAHAAYMNAARDMFGTFARSA